MENNTVTTIPNSISPYLNEIAERLWSGHAAIMVGAGFSKNASPNGTSTRGFPDWQQLGDLFYEKINGTKPDNKGKYLNVLKLADEVQAALGRPALDQSLRDVIPDYEYEPSPLHVKLLDLPWTDVFTTNYDTLLERACISVSSQKYDVVINKEDLVYSEKPRIIKLHGSFPSERPFIITEEDYRRYPKYFAPFVNTVQQSLLENTLCLIGFSGDDPNFLQWIGWIRDNLGSENSPKIYLIGVLYLSSAQKKLLEQRNIVLIDMAACSDINRSHYKGLERFLDYLLSRKNEDNRLGWPENSELSSELSQPVPQREKLIKVEGIVQIWRKQRLAYPGWVSVPEDRRSFLWVNTRNWIEFITSEDKLPGCLDLEFVYELNWRLEKCLLPLLSIQQAEFFETVLKKYWTQSEIINLNELSDHVSPSSSINLIEADRIEVGKMCVPLMLSLMRFYRTEGLQEKWKGIDRKIADSNLSKYLTAEHKASLYYEHSLFALFRLDILELKQKIEEWPINESLPLFEAKRAALLAEIGEVNTAESILEKSLKNVRALLNLKPITTDYSLVSQEAIIMLLLRYVQLPKSFGNADQNKFSERWNVLKQYKCDPWNELILFASALERPPLIKSSSSIKQEFDIGRTTSTNHFVNEDSEALIAYHFLIFCEDIGLPFRIPMVDIRKKSAKGTLLRISQYSPFWSMVTLVRIGDQKTVDYIFNREYLSRINEVTIDELITGYVEILNKVQDKKQISNFSSVLAKVIPEILSRLCCKCSMESKEKLIKLLLKIYESDHKRIYSGIQNLTARLINSFSVQQRLYLIPTLLNFPIPEKISSQEEREFINPFHFLNINITDIETWDKPVIPEERISILFEKGMSVNANERRWAISCANQLHQLGFLDSESSNKFAEILWHVRDSDGLPDQTNLYRFAFLNLPHPTDVDPIALFKNYVLSLTFPIQKNSTDNGISFTRGKVALCDEIVDASKFLSWSDEEINLLFNRMIEWWDSDKDYLKKDVSSSPFGSVANEFRARFIKLIDALAALASESDLSTSNINKSELLRLISELQDYKFQTLRLESACLNILPEFKNVILGKIESGLSSNNDNIINDSLNAILAVAKLAESHHEFDELLSHLLTLIGQIIFWRKQPGLLNTLKVLNVLEEKIISQLHDELKNIILAGLQNIAKDTDMTAENQNLSEKLAIRQEAAGFAYKLFLLYKKQGKQIPDSILGWKNICHSDMEFAEIRNQWLSNDAIECN